MDQSIGLEDMNMAALASQPISASEGGGVGNSVFKLPIHELVDAYRRRALSPVEVLEQQFRRIDEFGAAINAFVYLEREQAIAAARASEGRYAAGEPLGLLDGVSFSAKDGFSIAGRPFRRGSKATPQTPAALTSPSVARCLETGAVFIGSTTMPEFGIGPITVSPLTGVTANPWDTSKHAGGSSGGAAASIAAGFSTFALGTDAGGSNRIPSALTGVVGYKPSGGRVPTFPVSGAGNLSCPGPVANSVRDIAAVMNIVARYDARDANALPPEAVDYSAELSGGVAGLRVAYSPTLGFAKLVHPEIGAAVRAIAQDMGALGVTVEEVDPEVSDPVGWYVNLLHAGNQYALRKLTDEQKAVLSPAVRWIVEGPPVSIQAYFEAQERSRELGLAMVKLHQRFDIVMTPTVAAPAFETNRVCPVEYDAFENKRAWTPFVSIFNLTQQPAISIPIGLTRGGLPIGLQLAAPRFQDALLLRFAKAVSDKWPFAEEPKLSTTRRPTAPAE
jgi:aspartyl-tRNA(Asn)/glutamyl-tRNA(Gln) amidotransferase subunit A